MSERTPGPWITMLCGELLPNDVMIVADLGKDRNGIQEISTVARALSVRQSPEVTAANAAYIVKAVNAHDDLISALETAVAFIDPDSPPPRMTNREAAENIRSILTKVKS